MFYMVKNLEFVSNNFQANVEALMKSMEQRHDFNVNPFGLDDTTLEKIVMEQRLDFHVNPFGLDDTTLEKIALGEVPESVKMFRARAYNLFLLMCLAVLIYICYLYAMGY